MPNPCTLPLAELIQRCQEQTVAYLRTRQAGDDRYCLELFRRAVQEEDESAWAFIYTFYSTEEFLGEHYLLKWVRSWLSGRHGPAIRSCYTEEEMVQEIWLRFMRADAAVNFNFNEMRHLMAFLRRLANNFAMDAARRRLPKIVEPPTGSENDSLENLMQSRSDRAEALEDWMARREAMDNLLEEVVAGIVTTEKEWLVFSDYFLDELPPRKVYQSHPGVFSTGEVETTRTRLVRRLRKTPYLLVRYTKIVILQDDERLCLLFDYSFVERWPDEAVLARFPALFAGQDDLLEAKITILKRLREHPAFLNLLTGGL